MFWATYVGNWIIFHSMVETTPILSNLVMCLLYQLLYLECLHFRSFKTMTERMKYLIFVNIFFTLCSCICFITCANLVPKRKLFPWTFCWEEGKIIKKPTPSHERGLWLMLQSSEAVQVVIGSKARSNWVCGLMLKPPKPTIRPMLLKNNIVEAWGSIVKPNQARNII